MNEFDNRSELPFIAGVNDEGQPVFESILVEHLTSSPDEVRLLKSPLLTRNLAAGDKVRILNPSAAEYELIQRSGNLCIRVFRLNQMDRLAEYLTPIFEKMDGTLDLENDRALVYSIHFSIGFQTIEDIMNQACRDYPDTVWYYGNVYDPEDGTTPLEWWLDFENQE